MLNSFHEALAEVLRGYAHARAHERIGRACPTWRRVMSIPEILTSTSVVRSRPRVTVRASAGQGAWARIPWVALLNADATTTTREGVYVIYLFREDVSGVYLTLNQGVTEPLRRLGTADGLTAVRHRAAELRQRVGALAAHGFELDRPLDLHSTFTTAQHYVASTIVHRFYGAEALAADADLLADLEVAMGAYDGLNSTPPATSSSEVSGQRA